MDLPHDHQSECPRCGYDQRGQMQQWQDACPLQSPCVECGFPIEWRDLLSPKHSMPMWHVEYRSGALSVLIGCIRTLIAMLMPWSFWQTLKAAHRPVWSHVVIYILTHTLMVYICWGLLGCWLAYTSDQKLVGTWYAQYFHATQPSDYVSILLMPWSANDYTHVYSYRIDEISNALTLSWILIPLLSLLSCGAFATLPTTRRKCQVRWAHIIRIAALHVPLCHYLMIIVFALLYYDSYLEWLRYASAVLPFIWALLLWLNGFHACKHYLKMPHPAGVSFCMVLTAGLTTAVIGVFAVIFMLQLGWLG